MFFFSNFMSQVAPCGHLRLADTARDTYLPKINPYYRFRVPGGVRDVPGGGPSAHFPRTLWLKVHAKSIVRNDFLSKYYPE